MKTTAVERSNGIGKIGYCKICTWPGAQFLNKRYAADPENFNSTDARKLAETMDPEFHITRQLWYRHLEHITSPLVTAAEAAKRNPLVVPKTSVGALEMIRDLGMQTAIEHPETVGVDHALKAATELERSKGSTGGLIVLLGKMLGGGAPAEIEGEYHEVPQLETKVEEVNGVS